MGQTSDGKAVLSNPQAANSYSYAGGNPITNKDPGGRCPMCAVAIGAGVGAIGGIGSQALSDYLSGDFSGFSSYAVSAGQGAVVGGGVVIAGAAAAAGAVGTVATLLITGATAGTLTAATEYSGDYMLGRESNPGDIILNSSISAVSAGTLRSLPQVRGRMPNIGTQAFYTGRHTLRQSAEEFVTVSMQSLGQNASTYLSAGSGSASGSVSSKYQNAKSALSQASRALSRGNFSGAISALKRASRSLK